jgi:hypothetical protein
MVLDYKIVDHIVIAFQVRVQERLLGIRNIFKTLLELLV